jgi:hypothetical protein
MNDPLNSIFLSHDDAIMLRNQKNIKRLADYLEKMPDDLKPLFMEHFRRVSKYEYCECPSCHATGKPELFFRKRQHNHDE